MPDTKRDPYAYLLYNPYEIAPPPPKRSQWKVLMIVFWTIAIIVSGIVGYLYHPEGSSITQKTLVTPPRIMPIPTKIPTVNPDYTASSIFNDFRKASLIRPSTFTTESITIWSWSSDNYFVSIHATSSIAWSDDANCSGYCSPAALGLWVYATGMDAQNVSNQVGSDESTIGSIPMMGIPDIYVGGRCVLLSNDTHQINESYVSIMQNYCI